MPFNNDELRKIRLLVTDIDGVLTDAGMYYLESGAEAKKFNTRDGMGIVILREEEGIETVFMTRERNDIVTYRAKKLGIQHCYQGVMDKVDALKKLLVELDIKPSETAYVGDDVNDLEALKLVGFSFCPADAEDEIKAVVKHVCSKKGGEGVVREIANMIIRARREKLTR